MSDPYFVFRHSLLVVTDLIDYNQDEIFGNLSELQNELLGSPCLFKLDPNAIGMKRGYLVMDEDLDPNQLTTTFPMQTIKFPRAEYHYILHKGSFTEINQTYTRIEQSLEDENLKAINHPILVFPRGIPEKITSNTIIEIWTATDADFQGEKRLSDNVKIALPRKRFNFYTW